MTKRKLLPVFFACVLLAVVSLPMFSTTPHTWVSFNGSTHESKPSVIVLHSNELETVVEIELAGMIVNEVVENGETFHVLRFPYYGTTLEIGKPQLPIIKEMIGIPGDTDVSVSVMEKQEMTLTGYRVHPFQRPLLEEEKRVEFDIDKDLYETDMLYPERIVEVDKPAIWRDVRLVNLLVNPIRHNPAKGELVVCQKLTVKLTYEGKSTENVHDYGDRVVSQSFDKLYRDVILNYDYLNLQVRDPLEYEGPSQHYHLLIIAVDMFVDELAPLETWKETQGIMTEIHPLSTIVPPTAANIKNHITQEYNDHDIDYVLLVGDIATLPIYRGYTYNYGTIISDYWYALLAGGDMLPEVAVGRFSSTDEGEIDNMVDKTINFEDGPPALWHDDVLLVAHKQAAPDRYQRCKEEIRNAEDTQSNDYRVMYPNFRTEYGSLPAQGGNNATNADVITSIDNGRVVVNYRGHGSWESWYDWNQSGESFDRDDAAALNNGEMTPVVFSIACWNNDLDRATNCLGEAFTKPGDAAVAFLGASRPSYTNANHTYDKQLFAAVYDEGTNAVGHASNVAAIRMMQNHGTWGEDNAKMYLWLGDPSLAIPYENPFITYSWIVLIDTTGSMTGNRMDRAKNFAKNKVSDILNDPDDQVALATFAGSSGFTLLIDWTRDEQSLRDRIDELGANGMTPLADAVCAAVDKHITDGIPPGTRRIVLISDGDENWSTGLCSGDPDTGSNPPWCDDLDSWHCKVLTYILNNAVCDVAYFGNVGGAVSGIDDPIGTNSEVEDFLNDIADTTGGDYYDPELDCGNGVLDPGEQCDVGYPCNQPYYTPEFECVNCQCVPTAISLVSFTAEYREGTVEISWTTASEINNAGFNVNRGLSNEGPITRLNEELIVSEGNELHETSYTLFDNDIIPGMTYFYWLEDINLEGDVTVRGPVSVKAEMGGPGDETAVPVSFTLSQNYPNPFNPVTEIMYDLPVDCHVILDVYDVLGRRVITLVNEHQKAGSRIATWDGRNERGVPVSSGVYFYRIQAGTFIEVKKMALTR